MLKQIIVRLQVEGLHRWKDCPIDEVSFLRDRHRHIFHIEARKRVSHNDRDVEIILFKRQLESFLGAEPIEFGDMSCEMIAEKILLEFDCDYVQVLEDNENGAVIRK
jgi:hypothetical protein